MPPPSSSATMMSSSAPVAAASASEEASWHRVRSPMTAVTREAWARPRASSRGSPARSGVAMRALPSPAAMPTAVAMVPSMPAWPRFENTGRPARDSTARSKARTGLEAPSTRGPRVAEATARARESMVRPDPAARRASMRRPASSAAACTRATHSAPQVDRRGATRAGTTTEALPEMSTQGAWASTTTTRTSGRASSAWMGRDRVGLPVTTTVSTSPARGEETMACS